MMRLRLLTHLVSSSGRLLTRSFLSVRQRLQNFILELRRQNGAFVTDLEEEDFFLPDLIQYVNLFDVIIKDIFMLSRHLLIQ